MPADVPNVKSMLDALVMKKVFFGKNEALFIPAVLICVPDCLQNEVSVATTIADLRAGGFREQLSEECGQEEALSE